MSTEVKIIGGIALSCLVVMIGAIFFFNKPTSSLSEPALNTDALVKSDSPVLGTGKKVTIVEFADFQCPACGAAAPYLEETMKKYGSDARLVFRHFPLSQHQNAIPAAKAAEAAGMQGKFWPMYVALYAHQAEWSDLSDPQPVFEQLAKDAGVNIEKFREDQKNPKIQEKIGRDVQEGNTLGVNSTPTIFINGKKFEGSFTQIESTVKETLGK